MCAFEGKLPVCIAVMRFDCDQRQRNGMRSEDGGRPLPTVVICDRYVAQVMKCEIGFGRKVLGTLFGTVPTIKAQTQTRSKLPRE